MKKQLSILLLLVSIMGISVCAREFKTVNFNNTASVAATTTAPPAKTKPVVVDTPTAEQAKTVTSATHTAPLANLVNTLDVVKKPHLYVGKKINATARFDKFATLGLDYKPAFKSSETYISFLILRPDTDKNIPLSEMKLFLKRTEAEKLIDLKEGDKVQFTGTVFSSVLNDPWVDVEKLEKVK